MSTLHRFGLAIATTLLATGAAMPLASPAWADYETFDLSTGFNPDPAQGTGVSGGPTETECGYVAEDPDHVMTLYSDFSYLRINAEAWNGGDITLMIQRPDGEFICSDDVYGLQPEVTGYDVMAGTYYIWVGDWGESDNYTLSISEFE